MSSGKLSLSDDSLRLFLHGHGPIQPPAGGSWLQKLPVATWQGLVYHTGLPVPGTKLLGPSAGLSLFITLVFAALRLQVHLFLAGLGTF